MVPRSQRHVFEISFPIIGERHPARAKGSPWHLKCPKVPNLRHRGPAPVAPRPAPPPSGAANAKPIHREPLVPRGRAALLAFRDVVLPSTQSVCARPGRRGGASEVRHPTSVTSACQGTTDARLCLPKSVKTSRGGPGTVVSGPSTYRRHAGGKRALMGSPPEANNTLMPTCQKVKARSTATTAAEGGH